MDLSRTCMFAAIFLAPILLFRAGRGRLSIWRWALPVIALGVLLAGCALIAEQYLAWRQEVVAFRTAPQTLRIDGTEIVSRYDDALGGVPWTLPNGTRTVVGPPEFGSDRRLNIAGGFVFTLLASTLLGAAGWIVGRLLPMLRR